MIHEAHYKEYLKYKRHNYGIKSIVIKNLKSDASQCKFSSEEEVLQQIERCKRYLDNAKAEILEAFRKANTCTHDFNPSTYTVQGRYIGFVTVYERKCKHCRFTEYHTEKDDNKKPDWTKDAKRYYYNRF